MFTVKVTRSKIPDSSAYIKNINLTEVTDVKFEIAEPETQVTELKIENSIIPILSNDIFKHFPDLLAVDLSYCTIGEIGEDAFSGSKNITKINLDGCKLQKITENAFNMNPLLVIISLGHNNLKMLHENTFNRNQGLKHIDLQNNRLETLPKELFYHLVELETLYLCANKLYNIDVDCFKHLYHLKKLGVLKTDLIDFNFEKLLHYSPMLDTTALRQNDFHFDRLLEIVKLMKKHKIESFDCGNYNRTIDYPTLHIEGIDCVSAKMHKKLVEKRKLGQDEKNLVEKLEVTNVIHS